MRRYPDEPVSDYGQALWWLWQYSEPDTWVDAPSDDPLPPLAALVAMIWWVRPRDLRRHMRRRWTSEARMDQEAA